MGSYGSLLINNRLIRSTFEDIDWFINLIFHADDLKVNAAHESDNTVGGNYQSEEKHVLSAEAGIILERLNVLGYTDSAMKQDFNEFRQDKIDDLTIHIEDNYSVHEGIYIKELKFWNKYGIEDFLASIEKLIRSDKDKIRAVPYDRVYNNTDNYLVEHKFDLFGSLPFSNELFVIRAFLTVVNPIVKLVFDYTDLYESGQISDEDLSTIITVKDPIIVLTEGSSDIAVLKPSLEFLFPHLYENYSFFDFESFNSQGGSGSLVNMVKSFAGAGISNRIIALFDNDTAAREAQTILKDLSIPSHIAVLNYPRLAFAEHYPTIGPSGLNHMDINGLACSIELYLGNDVLKDMNGKLFPIFWKGYSNKM